MEFKKIKKENFSIKIIAEEDGKIAGRAYLYIIYNDLRDEPSGFMEDVFVEEDFRGRGIGTDLVKEMIEEAKRLGCHKIIGTSRYTRPKVHKWYESLGFEDYGKEFRMDL